MCLKQRQPLVSVDDFLFCLFLADRMLCVASLRRMDGRFFVRLRMIRVPQFGVLRFSTKPLRVAGFPHAEAPAKRASAWTRTPSPPAGGAHGETFKAGKEQITNKQPRTTAGVKGTPPPPPGSTLIPGLWPPPDRSVFRVWVPVYFVSGGTFHAAYLLRGCGASTPRFF